MSVWRLSTTNPWVCHPMVNSRFRFIFSFFLLVFKTSCNQYKTDSFCSIDHKNGDLVSLRTVVGRETRGISFRRFKNSGSYLIKVRTKGIGPWHDSRGNNVGCPSKDRDGYTNTTREIASNRRAVVSVIVFGVPHLHHRSVLPFPTRPVLWSVIPNHREGRDRRLTLVDTRDRKRFSLRYVWTATQNFVTRFCTSINSVS